MKNFQFIKNKLLKKKISFEVITFTDKKVSGRTVDTSVNHNYNPENAIKTLIIKTKKGFFAVILKATDQIDSVKFAHLVGKWSIINENELTTKFQMIKGGICPLILNIPILIDKKILNLKTLSMGAGDLHKGLNVATQILLNNTKNQIIDLSISKIHKSAILNNKPMDPIDNLLTRGVDKIYPTKEALEKVLRSGKKIKLYQGFDPSMPSLHLGNLVGLIKLAQFQKMGHEVIFLVGDFTGMIGDPTDKLATRKKLTRATVLENAKNWKEQAGKILDFEDINPAKMMFNSKWLDQLNFKDLIEITSNLTHQQLIERDMFQERIKNNQPIHFHELLYPIAQGYDSVAMDVDMEIGGRDQIFNMLIGRTLVSAINHKEKFVLGTKLLVDKEGNKVGKTTGNALFLDSTPQDFYSGIMSFPDEVIELGFELLTDVDFVSLRSNIKNQPMNEKKHLAFEIVKKLWRENNAISAQDYFSKTFQQHNLSDVKEFPINKLSVNPLPIVNLLVETDSVTSKSEAKRLIEQSAIEIDQTVVDMIQTNISLKPGMTLRVGKRKFLKFI